MAVNLRNVDEAKRNSKMSFSYFFKDSFVRRSSRHTGPRPHVCCCDNLDDVSLENEAVSVEPKHVSENCPCNGNVRSDAHKTGVFKKIKERLQLKANIVSRPMKCKSKQTAKILDSSAKTYPINMCDDLSEDFVQTSSSKANLQQPIRFVRSVNISRQCNKLQPPVHSLIETLPLRHREKSEEHIMAGGILNGAARVSCMMEDKKPCVAPRQTENANIHNPNNDEKSEVCNCRHLTSDRPTCLESSEPSEFIGDHLCDDALLLSNSTGGSLTCELFKLAKYGWYWGPITREEAEEKLIDLPDGAFLVRDSSADRYLLSVSFRSSGKTFHARIEYSHGLFSFYSFPGQEGFASIVDLINHSMTYSESAVFCYSRPRAPGYPSFPVRLAKPVSRFTQVRSLQYLCRFVIRQYVRVDNIQKLPLPSRLKGYIQEGHY